MVDTEVLTIQIGAMSRTLFRFLGLVLVLVGAYHMLVPIADPSVPTFAPWRQVGYVPIENLRGLFIGDVIVTTFGGTLTFFL